MNIEEWVNSMPLTDEEREVLSIKKSEEKDINFTDEEVYKMFFDRVDTQNLGLYKTHSLDVHSIGATNLITQLFDYYVNDETLVVCSTYEHPALKGNLYKAKHTLQLSDDDLFRILDGDLSIVERIIDEAKKHKFVFLYVIGMQNCLMKATPTEFYRQIKDRLTKENIPNIVCIDSVQEMFFYNRDYRIFDYVIGTGHASVKDHDIGFMMHKKELHSFNEEGNVKDLYYFLKQLDVMINRKEKFLSFRKIMSEHFKKNANVRYYELDTVEFAFSAVVETSLNKKQWERAEFLIHEMKYTFDFTIAPYKNKLLIRFRCQSYMVFHHSLENVINELEFALNLVRFINNGAMDNF